MVWRMKTPIDGPTKNWNVFRRNLETSKFNLQIAKTLSLSIITLMFIGIIIVLYMDDSLFGNK